LAKTCTIIMYDTEAEINVHVGDMIGVDITS